MDQIIIEHPTKFCGKRDTTKALIYGKRDGVRHNICPVDQEGEGCAGVLVDWDPDADYKAMYRVTDIRTLNPQD